MAASTAPPNQPHPGDVPMDEIRPLLDDRRLSPAAVGSWGFLRSHEREGVRTPTVDMLDEEGAAALDELREHGYVTVAADGTIATRRQP